MIAFVSAVYTFCPPPPSLSLSLSFVVYFAIMLKGLRQNEKVSSSICVYPDHSAHPYFTRPVTHDFGFTDVHVVSEQ